MSSDLEKARRQAEVRIGEAQLRVEEARRDAERALTQVRTAVETEVGILPKKKHVLFLLAGGAAGLALALRRRKSKRRKLKR
ncbi:MAG TPA: hypothetical protein VNM67_06300 [Thermoanaerobaculia bacterium]|jgi:hypothetical protein|nr:hypothetical protein [Thermoanaerobaculia bacterium]